MDASAWTEKSNEIKQAFLEKLNDAKWQKEKEEAGITIYKAKVSPGLCWKAETLYDGLSIDDVWANFQASWEARLKWDTGLQPTSCVLEQLSDTLSIDYSATNPALGGVISARDFVDLRAFERTEGKIVAWGSSVDYDKKASPKGIIRAWNHPCGTVLERVDNKTKFTLIWHSDIKGWVPSAAVNKAMPAQMTELIQVHVLDSLANSSHKNLERHIKSL